MTEPEPAPATDRDLLRAFADRRDGAAFAALVGRYGPFVYGVCRRVLGDDADADDAFQATFLVLARKAGGVGRPEQLGGWLHAVAVRCARRARSVRRARRGRERPMPDVPAPLPDPDWADVRPVLDEEVAALPEKLRSALVLCELQGLDRGTAAAALGVPEGTLSSRLARGKEALRLRLVKRGITLSAVGVGVALAGMVRAAVPPGVVEAAAAGGTGRMAVVSLANSEVSAMFWTKAVKVALVAGLLAAAGGGAVAVGYRPAVAAEEKPPDKDKLQGEWKITSVEVGGQDAELKDEVVGQTMTFREDNMKLVRKSTGFFEATFTLDPSKDPREADFTVVEGPATDKGKVAPAIYKLDGTALTLHLAHPGQGRPTGFKSEAGQTSILIVLERVKK